VNCATVLPRGWAEIAILNCANPRDLPVESLSKLSLVLNPKTAKALGLTAPQGLPVRAVRGDQVTGVSGRFLERAKTG
jgi:ABC-type uncharacterized transport system substrate-binding protein